MPNPKLIAANAELQALAEQTGAKTATGTIKCVKGKFVAEFGSIKGEILPGITIQATELNKLVGREVVGLISGKHVVAIGQLRLPRKWWTCYIPRPDLIKEILPELRVELIAKYEARGLIKPALAAILKGASTV